MGKSSNIQRLLRWFFLSPTQLQPKIQLLLFLLEQICYITIINGINYYELFPIFNNQIYLMFVLIISCLIRISLKICITPAFALIALQIILTSNSIFQIINFFLVAAIFLIQLIDSISFDISCLNVQSQEKNWNKCLHLALLAGNTILQKIYQSHAYLHIISSTLFLFAFLSKDKSLIKNEEYRTIRMRFYMWAFFEHLRLFIGVFILTNSILIFIATLALSQAFFIMYDNCSSKLSLQQLLAKGDYLQLCFLILKYRFSRVYDEKEEQNVKLICDDEMQRHLGQDQSEIQIILRLLDKSKSFQAHILRIELNIMNGRFIAAMQMLITIKNVLPWYHLTNRIVLSKLEYLLSHKYDSKSKLVTVIYESNWKQFNVFQQLLYKSAVQNLKLTHYLKRSIIELTIIKKITKTIIKFEDLIHNLYQSIKDTFIASTECYCAYLLKVKNDYLTAEKILSQYLISQKYLIDFDLDSKIYFKLRIEDRNIMIDKVGFNVKELLDYNRKELQGQKLERIIAPFLRAHHQNACIDFIHEKIESINLITKRSIILNNKQTYNECNIVLKLDYNTDEGFYWSGCVEIVESEKYNLQYFMFVDEKGKIVDGSQKIFHQIEFIDHNINEFFKAPTLGQAITQSEKLQTVTFHPIMLFHHRQNRVYFYAKKSFRESKSKKGITYKELKQVQQQQEQINYKHHNNSEMLRIQNRINNTEIMVLIMASFLLICTLFFSHYLLIFSSQVKFNNQSIVVTNGQVLMQYYNNLFILAVDLARVDLMDHFNYTRSGIQSDLIDVSLQLSSFNEILKQYNQGKYKISSSNPLITYSESNFELVQMLLVNSYTYHSFRNDQFLKEQALDAFRSLISTLLMNSFTDYRISVFNKVANFVQTDAYYNRIALIFNLANLSLIILIAIRLYFKVRKAQQMALTYRSYTVNPQKINQILEFFQQITKETIEIDKITPLKTILDTDTVYTTHSMHIDGELANTQSSFMKQMTKRNLMNDTFQQNLESTINNQIIEQKKAKFQFRKTKSYHTIGIVFGIFIVILMVVAICNQIINNTIRDVNQTASINSIVTLYRASAFYSRAFIVTLSTAMLKQQKNIDNSNTYYKQITSYYSYLNSFTLPIFPQTKFQEFNQYTTGYNQLYQLPICQYMLCKSENEKQLNLNFITIINKLSANLSSLVNSAVNLDYSNFGALINSAEINDYLNDLFDSQLLLRNYTINLSMIYLQNYGVFMNNVLSSKMRYITAIIMVTIVGLIAFAILAKYIRDEQHLFIKIIKIYY